MTVIDCGIPPSMPGHLAEIPRDRPVVLLLRHSVRDALPLGHAGYVLPITDVGRRLARALGAQLGRPLETLHSSPLTRCIQTAQELGEGAGVELEIVQDRLLGDPGAFALDGERAWSNWERLGHEGVMRHLVERSHALPGMARPDEAARFLVHRMLATAGDRNGVHVFVTHDSLVTATAARILGRPLGSEDWPMYLEGAFFWRGQDRVCVAYRGYQGERPGPICELSDGDVLEFARREVAATIGLDSGARFFLAGGVFKSLLTGRPPRDLDVWAPSEGDRQRLVEVLGERGARPAESGAFTDRFEIGGRVIEVARKVEPPMLVERLGRFDIGLSAVGVEHRPGEQWTVHIHPLALESVRRRRVLLLKPLVNWKYALTTLERMRRYALELGYESEAGEESEIWRVFDGVDQQEQARMIERYRETGRGEGRVLEEATSRR